MDQLGSCHGGEELMNLGLIATDASAGQPSSGQPEEGFEICTDFWSKIYVLTANN